MSDDVTAMGPIDYLVVEFPGSHMTGEGLPILVDLVDRGIIRIIDLAFARKREDGSVVAVELADLVGEGQTHLSVFDGVSSGVLAADDLEEAAAVLSPGDSAGVLVYENLWAAPFAAALRRGGAQVVASGRIPVDELVAALDDAEARTPTGSR